MKHLFLILLLLIVPFVYSQDCNTLCLDSGYSSGICTDSCAEIEIDGADDCALEGHAVLVIGSNAVETYRDLDPSIGDNKTSPNWRWIIKNLKTKTSTNILNRNDETAHSGPILGIKNDFVATDIDDIGMNARKIGESFCFP